MCRFAVAAVLTALPLCAAAGADWRAVPDAPELLLDVESLQSQRGVVSGWVRHAAASRAAIGLAPAARDLPAHQQTAVLAEFDCHGRTVRTVGVLAYDSQGRLLASSSTPGRPQPLPEAPGLLMLYDAICELARGDAR